MKKLILLSAVLFSMNVFSQDWGDVEKNEVTLKEIAPVWPGCENEVNPDACFDKMLMQHVVKNFRYPANAYKANVQEKIIVNFMINTKGEVEILKVKGENEDLKEEAKRNILAIPKMKPGKLAGKPKAIEYTVPFNFKTGK